jgi:hypothetical protein
VQQPAVPVALLVTSQVGSKLASVAPYSISCSTNSCQYHCQCKLTYKLILLLCESSTVMQQLPIPLQ